MGDGVFEVLSTSGDTHLGGDDFDRRIVDYLADDFQRGEGIDLRKDRQALQRLTEAAEKAKMELSTLSQVTAHLWWPSQHCSTHPCFTCPKQLNFAIETEAFWETKVLMQAFVLPSGMAAAPCMWRSLYHLRFHLSCLACC